MGLLICNKFLGDIVAAGLRANHTLGTTHLDSDSKCELYILITLCNIFCMRVIFFLIIIDSFSSRKLFSV